MAVSDGDTVTLGGTTLKLYVIPGHTLGTLATVFTLHDKGEGTAPSRGAAPPIISGRCPTGCSFIPTRR
jgi:glyoxylase-like metal-dependent hydrolase (beta-lactamase superfamily II)